MKKSAVLLAFLLILTSLIPTAFAAADLTHTQEYIPETHTQLGWIGYDPLTIAADGSFSLEDTKIQFGCTTKIAHIDRPQPYPSTTHTFSDGTLYYNLHLFVNEQDFNDIPCLILYARLTVENLTKESAAFPIVSAQLTALTDVPGEVSSGGKAACDYAIIIRTEENDVPAGGKEEFDSFDDKFAAMKAFWDKQLSKGFTLTEMPEEASPYVFALQTEYIDLLCGISTNDAYSLAAPLQKLPADTSALSCFDAALYYMKTEDSDFLDSIWENLQKQYTQICDILEVYTFTVSEQEEQVQLLPGSSPEAALEENLNALIELKAFAFLCRRKDPALEDAVLTAYQKLLSSVETVMRNTVSYCTSHWSVTNLPGSLSQGIFSLSANSSAAAAANWYKRDSVFNTSGGGTYLKRLARQQLPYLDETGFSNSFSFIDSIVSQSEDGTIILGHGLPGAWLYSNAPLSFEKYPLAGGGTLSCTITGEANELHIKLSPSTPTAASLEFPVFCSNIEYASCGFDSENGIVSVPAGVTEITVRLKKDIETITQAYQNEHELEAAIAAFEGMHLAEYTKYSVSLFAPALENAKAARTGPASEMHKAAADLHKAAAKLSRTQSAYTLSLYQDSSASPVGNLEADEILQTFTSKKAGTLSEIFIKGTYSEGITAVIYSVQKDGVSPGDLLGEAKGEVTSTGILFPFSVALEADTGYLLSVFSETDSVTLPVYPITQDAPILYAKTGNDTVAYDFTSIGAVLQITQANMKDLDVFLEKCMAADVTSYTKESRNRLEKEMKAAKELLCTQSVTEDEYKSVYTNLKDAYAALATYPSDAPVEKTPAALYVVLGIAALLLIAGGVGAVASYKKREW